jgi:hypothetical protein
MRATLTGLAFAGALSLVCYQSAEAIPADAAATNRAATAASTVQDAQFYARPTRHGIIKCYREFVVGRPVCRHFVGGGKARFAPPGAVDDRSEVHCKQRAKSDHGKRCAVHGAR